jgi:hypothetical protein
MSAETLFIFVDESGNFDFSESGTRHLVMTAVLCFAPAIVALKMLELKYRLYKDGFGVSSFHATADKQTIRNMVFARIADLDVIEAHTMWLDKRKMITPNPSPNEVFTSFGKFLINVVSSEGILNQMDNCVIVFDKTLLHREEIAFRAATKQYFSRLKVPVHIYFHNVNREPISQVADYIAWAQYVLLERNEQRPLDSLPRRLKRATQLNAVA